MSQPNSNIPIGSPTMIENKAELLHYFVQRELAKRKRDDSNTSTPSDVSVTDGNNNQKMYEIMLGLTKAVEENPSKSMDYFIKPLSKDDRKKLIDYLLNNIELEPVEVVEQQMIDARIAIEDILFDSTHRIIDIQHHEPEFEARMRFICRKSAFGGMKRSRSKITPMPKKHVDTFHDNTESGAEDVYIDESLLSPEAISKRSDQRRKKTVKGLYHLLQKTLNEAQSQHYRDKKILAEAVNQIRTLEHNVTFLHQELSRID